jgi:hypothetical protein
MLALVSAEVEDFKSAIGFVFGLQLPLHADHAFARGVDGELAKVAGDPLAPQLFGDGSSRAGAAEKVCDQVAFIGLMPR